MVSGDKGKWSSNLNQCKESLQVHAYPEHVKLPVLQDIDKKNLQSCRGNILHVEWLEQQPGNNRQPGGKTNHDAQNFFFIFSISDKIFMGPDYMINTAGI